jgi:hypothetical protein
VLIRQEMAGSLLPVCHDENLGMTVATQISNCFMQVFYMYTALDRECG